MAMTENKQKEYYTGAEAAKILRLHHSTLYKYIEQGLVEAKIVKKLKKKHYLIPASEIQRLKKELEIE